MNKKRLESEIIIPKNQMFLIGYDHYFNLFVKLFEKKKLPNTILLSGLKGSGKSTFAYHFVNYLLSTNEDNKYSLNDFIISKESHSYKLINTNTHPNFFLIDSKMLEKDIKIDQIRNLLKFLSKSTYSKDLKLVIIDDVEYLNLNSSNALLKAIEEPKKNTFFLIIQNSASKIQNTIKSRCVEFKIFHNISEKVNIFNKIINQYQSEHKNHEIRKNLYFDSPGNLLKYFLLLENANINISESNLKCVSFFIDMYIKEKNPATLSFITLFINKFYNELSFKNNKIINLLFNQSKINKLINDMKKFNLNEKNIFISITDILLNETK